MQTNFVKTILTTFLASLSTLVMSQAPQKFNYQGIARDNTGTELSNQLITLQVSILNGSESGVIVYTEQHSVRTNSFGLFNLEVGSGTTVDDFSDVDWGTNSKWLRLEVDFNGGSNFELLGTSQLLSVPYALYSGSSKNGIWSDNGSGDIYSPKTGNVLIGKTTTFFPNDSKYLELEEDYRIYLRSSNPNYGSIYINPETDGSLGLRASAGIQYWTSAGPNGSSWSEKMRLTKEGNLGIGTDSPNAKLEVVGQTLIGDRLLGANNSSLLTNPILNINANQISSSNEVGLLQLTSHTSSDGNTGDAGTFLIGRSNIPGNHSIFLSSNDELTSGIGFKTRNAAGEDYRMVIDHNGKIGIGEKKPTSKLFIKDNISSGLERNLLNLRNTNTGFASYTGMILKTGNSSKQSVIQDYGENYTASLPNYDWGGRLNISNNNRGILLHANNANGQIKFYTGFNSSAGAGFERMIIDENGKVGIGTVNPSKFLSIEKTAEGTDRTFLQLENKSTSNSSYVEQRLIAGNSNSFGAISHNASSYSLLSGFADKTIIHNTGKGLILRSLDSGVIELMTGATGSDMTTKMIVNKQGNVGIGTSIPESKLTVSDGDIYLDNATNGVIMTSPNGSCFRMTVSDTGTPVFTSIACP